MEFLFFIQILSLPIRNEIDRTNLINTNERHKGIRTEEDVDQSEGEVSQDTSTSDENETTEEIIDYSETNP